MRPSLLLPASVCVLLGACTTPLTYGNDAARASCNHQKTCEPEAYDALWSDDASCVDTVTLAFGGSCYIDHCNEFDASNANSCVAALRSATCDDDANSNSGDCAKVWSDCESLALLACLAEEGLSDL